MTHSLTQCCAWLAEGRSDLHNEQSRVANWQALMGRPISSSTCWSQVFRGRLQSVAGVLSVKASMDRCNACEAGVSRNNRQIWPKIEWRRSAMREGRSVSPVVSFIAVLVILSYRFTPRIRRWDCMWNDWTLSLSIFFLTLHVSEPYSAS